MYESIESGENIRSVSGENIRSKRLLKNTSWKYYRTLPPIPQNITLTNLERHRNIAEISWQMFYSELPDYNLVFVLEARSHIGYYFDEQKLSNWFSMAFEVTSSTQKYEKDKGGLMTNEYVKCNECTKVLN